MPTTTERYTTVAAGFAERIARCADDAWDAPTPCADWTVRQLVDHVIEVNRSALEASGWPIAVSDTDDIAEQWTALAAQVAQAMDDPTYAAAPTPSPFGELAFKQLAGGVILHDVLVHTWDLARATGQSENLDPEAVASAHAKMRPFDQFLRGPGMFGPAVSAPDDTDDQTQLLAFVGRHVR